jgi:hypothetical protein
MPKSPQTHGGPFLCGASAVYTAVLEIDFPSPGLSHRNSRLLQTLPGWGNARYGSNRLALRLRDGLPEVGLVPDGAPRTGLFVCGHLSQYAL